MLTCRRAHNSPSSKLAAVALLLASLHLGTACSSSQPDSSRAATTEVAPSHKRATQPPLLIAVTDGLAPAHLGTPPLVEKVAYIPASEHGQPGREVAIRVYPDGTYYMLVSEANGAPISPRWQPLLTIDPERVQRLEALFARICGAADSLLVDDIGSTKYHVTSRGCTRTFVNGLPSNQSPVAEADKLINENPQRIPPSP